MVDICVPLLSEKHQESKLAIVFQSLKALIYFLWKKLFSDY